MTCESSMGTVTDSMEVTCINREFDLNCLCSLKEIKSKGQADS